LKEDKNSFFLFLFVLFLLLGEMCLKQYVDFILRKAKKPLSLEDIVVKLEGFKSGDDSTFEALSWLEKKKLEELLAEGVANYEYFKNDNGAYMLLTKTAYRKGVFHGNRGGDGYVSVINSYFDRNDELIVKEENYIIMKDNCNGAIDGDTVLLDIGEGKKHRVCDVLDRNLSYVAGEVIRIGAKYYVKAIDKKKQNLTILLDGEAIEGQKVLVHLRKSNSNNFYLGEIKKIFGHKNDPDDEILWEAYECGIETEFSDESLRELEYIPDTVRDMDKIGRMDLTDWEIFTIDGDDTKDIDDALSLKKLDNGNYLIGVHIADVSYYVKPGSALDRDAFKKGNSYYLAGRVIPMLPPKLSNGICSLNPQVERLAMSCLMEVTPTGDVVNHTIAPTVIRSRLKMTYSKVNDLLKNGNVDKEYEPHARSLLLLNKLALVLRNNRLNAGAVEFDRPELKLLYSDDGKVSDTTCRYQDFAENLIQEYMLLANETVDRHLVDLGLPCLHRIHDKPNSERLEGFIRL